MTSELIHNMIQPPTETTPNKVDDFLSPIQIQRLSLKEINTEHITKEISSKLYSLISPTIQEYKILDPKIWLSSRTMDTESFDDDQWQRFDTLRRKIRAADFSYIAKQFNYKTNISQIDYVSSKDIFVFQLSLYFPFQYGLHVWVYFVLTNE